MKNSEVPADMHKQPTILMYHGVTNNEPFPVDREAGAELYDVDIEDFRTQMQWLKKQGYVVSRIEDAQNSAHTSSLKKLVLTFDDGEMNNCANALPVLEKMEFSGYFFIIATRVGKPGYMGWNEIKKLHNAGMVIGSHGFTHEILTNLLDTQVEEELLASKKYLERNLDLTIDTLSIPRGFCTDKIINMAHETGYKHVFISERSQDMQTHCYSRIAVKGNWRIDRLQKALNGEVPQKELFLAKCKILIKKIFGGGGYDWIRSLLLKIK